MRVRVSSLTSTLALLPVLAGLSACRVGDSPGQPLVRIDWDTWGIPHISASSDADFFMADGWAQMHAHANTILRLYGTSRGRAAEYWGERHLQSDQLVHTLGHPGFARVMRQRQDPESRAMTDAFVAGMNAYAKAHPDVISEENRTVLPLTALDVLMHAQFVVNTRFLAYRELRMAGGQERGSNAIAIGPSRSASGHAMLIQNPHLPWFGEFLWFEKHLLGADRNIYGAQLVGMPGFGIAFNDFLGWSHTNNTIDNADLYRLELAGDAYLYDGVERPFNEHTVTLKVRGEDGSMGTREMTVLESLHGPVVRRNGDHAFALKLAADNYHDSFLQWWRMANARNFDEFDSALNMAQIPFWNVMYADREGNIFYLFNGHVPVRRHGDWAYWREIVDGSDPRNEWAGIHAQAELPRILNPTTGWLQNANDPPWTSTVPQALSPDDFPAYMSPRGMSFRPQRSARLANEDASVSFEELVDIKHDTRMELAERLMDDLLEAAEAHGSDHAREAARVLAQWDRRADNDSRGAVLFQAWAGKASRAGAAAFSTPWDPERPLSTPDGLASPEAAAEWLDLAAAEVLERHGDIAVPWGQVNRIEYNGHSLPANGAAGSLGVFRVAAGQAGHDGTQVVRSGDSWVGVIEFGDTPRARVLLSYGNATQPGSPHYGDQLELFSRQELREAWRTREQLHGRIRSSEQLENGRFVGLETLDD